MSWLIGWLPFARHPQTPHQPILGDVETSATSSGGPPLALSSDKENLDSADTPGR